MKDNTILEYTVKTLVPIFMLYKVQTLITQEKYVHKNMFTMKAIFCICYHFMLKIINKKCNRRKETNDEINPKNLILNYCRYQSLDQSFKVVFTTAANLKSILCNNKSKLLPRDVSIRM